MTELYGKFICPICKYNGITGNNDLDRNNFKQWLCIKSSTTTKFENKWAFFESMEVTRWVCCSCCGDGVCGKAWRMLLTCKYWKECGKGDFSGFGGPENGCLACLYLIVCFIFFLYFNFFLDRYL